MSSVLLALRNGTYVTRQRMTGWSCIFLIGFVGSIAFLWLTAHGLNDYAGRPLGTDFSNIYAAGVQASHGHATAPFDIERQRMAERAIFGAATPLYGWHYPPFFLFIAGVLAQLPYLLALAVWQVATLLLYLAAIWLLIGSSAAPNVAGDWLWLVLALSFTAVWVNLTHGHNGFLTCALFASAIAFIDKRPVLSGVLFGLLCYKPQFVCAIPLALIAARRWPTLLALVITVMVLAAAVTFVFGSEVWTAFLDSTHFTRVTVLEQGNTGFYKIQSVFAWARMWGGSVATSYLLQSVIDFLIAIALVRLWRSPTSFAKKGASLCLAALLVTPYSLDYDLVLLAPAIVLLATEGLANSFEPFEATLLAVLWFLPIASRPIGQAASIPIAVPAMLHAFVLIYRSRTRRCPTAVDVTPSTVKIG